MLKGLKTGNHSWCHIIQDKNRNPRPSRTIRVKIIRGIILLTALFIAFICGIGVGVNQWPPFSSPKDVKEVLSREPATPKPAITKTSKAAYQVTSYRHSYFKLNSSGALELKSGLPYRFEDLYRFERTIHPGKTAIVIMDPWVDMASTHLNKTYGMIIETRILPLAKKAFERGHSIIALTNDPDSVEYNTNIHPELSAMASSGELSILYHQDLDDEKFAEYLHSKGINTLIYMGFASNMCVIGRRMGMIPMGLQGFRLFFVPQASAAVEYQDTWDNQLIHQITTKIISQSIAEIIDYEMFMRTIND